MVHNKLKSWWHLLAILNTQKKKKKTLKFTWQHFGTQSSLWVKINLDPMVKWRGLDKINVYKIYNTFFQQPLVASCLWFMKHYQTKENWKNNVVPIHKISPFWCGSGFSLKRRELCIYCYFIPKKKEFKWSYI